MKQGAILFVAAVWLAVATACVPPPTTGGNQAPTALATAAPVTATTGERVLFTSAGSADTDGTIVSYAWDLGDGTLSADADPTHIYDVAGSYAVSLTVTDDDGATATDSSVTVEVTDSAAGRYVATTGADAGDCATSAAKCATINYAVGQATAGDSIYVEAGNYLEMVNPDKALRFAGSNAALPAGVDAVAREGETTVRGFRGTTNSTAFYDFTLDGFEVDPTSDPALLTNAVGIINIFGGPTVSIVNNVFTGAVAYVPTCGFTCTAMGDYAMQIRAGNIDISDNAFTNWRRPVNVIQALATTPITSATISDNSFTGITSRAMSIAENTGQGPMAGAVVDGNFVDATGRDPVASTPAGITITNASNTVSNNTFSGFSTGVYMQLCKKWSQADNTITGNLFSGNSAGVNVTTFLDTSQCNRSATEGTDGWVVGGGVADGLAINDNTFVGQTSYAIRFNPNFGTYTPAVTAGPLDATCNFYDDAAGPGGTNGIVQGPPSNAQIEFTPWLTSATGPCDGT